jgi:hypothetical protein
MDDPTGGERVQVRYVDGRANVRIGERALTIDRRNDLSRADSCPIELVTAALGG